MHIFNSLSTIAGRICDNSISFGFLRKLYAQQGSFWLLMSRILRESRTNKIISAFSDNIRICFRNSFLGRITEVGMGYFGDILKNSECVKLFLRWYSAFFRGVKKCSATSMIIFLYRVLRERFHLFPVRTVSIIVIVLLPAYTLLSVFCGGRPGLINLLIMGGFLFIAYNGLHSDVSWEELNRTSFFLKRLK